MSSLRSDRQSTGRLHSENFVSVRTTFNVLKDGLPLVGGESGGRPQGFGTHFGGWAFPVGCPILIRT